MNIIMSQHKRDITELHFGLDTRGFMPILILNTRVYIYDYKYFAKPTNLNFLELFELRFYAKSML